MSTQNAAALQPSDRKSAVRQITDSELDTIFHLLSSSRRRSVLVHLDTFGPLEFDELQRLVAEDEFGIPWEEIENSRRHTIYVSLHQTHLPTLDDAGVITRDANGEIMLGDADRILAHLPEKRTSGFVSFLTSIF